MTNPVKGEVTFEARGQTFTFKLGTNAQIMLEQKTGQPLGKWLAEKQKDNAFSAADMRNIFHAGLYRQHKMTEDDVGDLIDELGVDRISEIFSQAAAMASAERRTNGAADEPRPTKAKAAPIGMNS